MPQNAFSRFAYRYAECELSVIPIEPGQKRPGSYSSGRWLPMQKWEEFNKAFPTDQDLERWSRWPGAGIGLLTGELSKVVALDFDDRPDLHEHIEGLVPPSPVRKVGSRGYTAFYRYAGEVSRKFVIGKDTVVELLSDGRQTVLPPTDHPSGLRYRWLTEESLLTTRANELPFLGMKVMKRLEEFFESFGKPPKEKPLLSESILEDIREALKFIPAENYSEWIRVGMALASLMPGEAGLILWDFWSKSSSKYDPEVMRKKWASFSSVREISINTLFWMARQNGYRGRPPEPAPVTAAPATTVPPARAAEPSIALSEKLLRGAPGLVGRIADWINETSIYEHPALSLAASLAAVGALKGHRVRTETNLRTNILAIGIAPSGAGKNHAMEQVETLFFEANLTGLFGGKPASDAGLLKLLSSNGGRRLIQWDELGIAISEMTARGAGVHRSAILGTVMELFSKAGTTYHGKEYANHDGKSSRVDIQQPCLSVYGATTPQRFYDSLTSSHTVDGFLARWLIFETHERYPKRRKVTKGVPPPDLIDSCVQLDRYPTNVAPEGNVDGTTHIRPRVQPFTPEAANLMDDAIAEFDAKRESSGSDAVESLWARAAEHAMKLALTVDDASTVGVVAVRWALAVVRSCMDSMVAVIKNQIADNERQKSLNWMRDIIAKAGPAGIPKWELTRKTHRLPGRDRDDIIRTLCDSDLIDVEVTDTTSRGGIVYKIR